MNQDPRAGCVKKGQGEALRSRRRPPLSRWLGNGIVSLILARQPPQMKEEYQCARHLGW